MKMPTASAPLAYWDRLYGCAQARAVWDNLGDKPALLVVPDMNSAVNLQHELQFFAGSNENIYMFPDWETLPYDVFSPHQDIISARLKTLLQLQRKHKGLYIIAIETLLQKLPPPSFLTTSVINLTAGDTINLTDFRRRLEESGYRHVPQVCGRGEYALRGSILDFFPSSCDCPLRLDWFGDEIDSIRTFDVETQISIKTIPAAEILPAREFPFDEQSIIRFRQQFRELIDSAPEESSIYRNITDGRILGGIEYYLPLFFEHTATFFDYLPADAIIFFMHDMQPKIKDYWGNIDERYNRLSENSERPPLKPEYIFLDMQLYEQHCNHFHRVLISSFKEITRPSADGATKLLPTVALQSTTSEPVANFKTWLDNFNGRTLIVAETAGYRELLLEMLAEHDIHCKTTENWHTFLASSDTLAICTGIINQGTCFEQEKLAIITDGELLGHKVKQRRKNQATNTKAVIQNLNDLEIGAPVVHEQHGVGRFRGLKTIDIGGCPSELLVIEYADKDKLYVPISALHLISRYTGGNPETAPLHQLGSDQWKKSKQKAEKKALDTAAELLDIYTRRNTATGTAFTIDEEEYKHFAAAFPYQETPDQLQAIDEVFAQMKDNKPMDHIVCGDVGFGKTEIAMRAAFIAVQNGFQVAILVPTTLLANQHLQSFRARFADWPIRIAMLSRFISSAQQKKTLKETEAGLIDIVIGTHKLLQKKIKFKQLGLIVTDEEQRFGVRHKEYLKSSFPNVDMLTLSATPLPRTLNMSLSGLRTLSIIAIPPPHRYAVKTYINDWSDELISEACFRELRRGGQVYFVHNNIDTIEEIEQQLRKLLPNADIRIAHGKLPEQKLENIMLDFYRHQFDILLCTTIIESGIDIPTANSIIIHQAERFGLAQLHQLRGRVGRSHHRAYAYLLLGRPRALLSSDAIKRLEAIESLEDLGIGFALASQDLEIRGAGELLGEEQSGHIQEIGFTLYHQILKRAVDTLRSGKVPDMDKPLNIITEVNCGEPALIPADYVPDTNIRLILYRRIAAIEDKHSLTDLKREMTDRFGLLPIFVKNLFVNGELRLICRPSGITKIEIGQEKGIIEFNQNPDINVTRLLTIVKENPAVYSFASRQRLIIRKEMETVDYRIKTIKQLLNQISSRNMATT